MDDEKWQYAAHTSMPINTPCQSDRGAAPLSDRFATIAIVLPL